MDKDQRERFARQLILPELGEAGQERLLSASVLVAGAGGLGAPVLLYLAAMGIGRLHIVDGDVVSPSNLNRQLLYAPADLGQGKAETAAAFLAPRFPATSFIPHPCFLTADNLDSLLADCQLAVDCLDNFEARFLLNDACLRQGKTMVHGGVWHLNGQIMTVRPGGPCLRCLFPQGYRSGSDPLRQGVIGATAGVIGALQAMEVYKCLTGLPVSDRGPLCFDGVRGCWQEISIEPLPTCVCQVQEAAE